LVAAEVASRKFDIRTEAARSRIIRQALQASIYSSAAVQTESITGTADQILSQDLAERREFEFHLSQHWDSALRMAELTRLVSLEAGVELNKNRAEASGDDEIYQALIRLHARACLIASETIALLRAGHASGAHARWRALHEVSVVAEFLREGDQTLSRRYLLYEHVESFRAIPDYQRYASQVGEEPLTDKEVEAMRHIVDRLVGEFGPEYAKSYGWAVPPFARAPHFREIEEEVGLNWLRPYYRMASYPTHAGPKGTVFDIGQIDSEDMMLAGPSNAGLGDPGLWTCNSLMLVTTALLTLEPSAESLASAKVVASLTKDACAAFRQAATNLRRDLEQEEKVTS
jgi:hypothetical protein